MTGTLVTATLFLIMIFFFFQILSSGPFITLTIIFTNIGNWKRIFIKGKQLLLLYMYNYFKVFVIDIFFHKLRQKLSPLSFIIY